METLPPEILENILYRLPIQEALKAKWVCKTWRILLRYKTDTNVGLLFAESSDHILSFNNNSSRIERRHKLYCVDQFDYIRGKMNYTYYDIDEMVDSGKSIPWYKYIDNMLGSCNGLVCFQRQRPYLTKPFLICNPFTGEVVFVPKVNPYTAQGSLAKRPGDMISGFGYCHSTKEYKIVSMHYVEPSKKSHVQVYTVGGGAGGWRSKGSTHIPQLDSPIGINANGYLHWLDNSTLNEGYSITAFGLEDEEFHFIPFSHVNDAKHNQRPKLLTGNNLYLVYTILDHTPYSTYIWSYKRKTTDGCHMKENYKDKCSWHWIKEFRIEWEERYWKDLLELEPLEITRNNEFFFRFNNNIRTLLCYDLNTSSLTKFFLRCSITAARGWNMINVIPHAKSIVSILSSEDKITKTNERNSKRKERELRRLEWNGSIEDLKIENLGRGQRYPAKKRKT